MGFVVNYPPQSAVTVDQTVNTVSVEFPPPTTVLVDASSKEVVVAAAGPRGPKGDPGIIVSETPPPNPVVNDLWIDIS